MNCSLCSCEFDPDEEGMAGTLGLMPVGFCQTCNAGVVDYVFQAYGQDEADKMGENVAVIPLEFLNHLLDQDVLYLDLSGAPDKRTLN